MCYEGFGSRAARAARLRRARALVSSCRHVQRPEATEDMAIVATGRGYIIISRATRLRWHGGPGSSHRPPRGTATIENTDCVTATARQRSPSREASAPLPARESPPQPAPRVPPPSPPLPRGMERRRSGIMVSPMTGARRRGETDGKSRRRRRGTGDAGDDADDDANDGDDTGDGWQRRV